MPADPWWTRPQAERLATLRRLSASDLSILYQLALAEGASRPPDAAVWLGAGTTPVCWSGKNPLPAWLPVLSCFEKRFFVEEGGVWGYNHTRYQALAGPGYFGLMPAERLAAAYRVQAPERQWVLDYRMTPPSAPAGSPAVLASEAAAIKVFAGLRDFVLPLGDDLLVGAAFSPERPETPIAHFALLRSH